jgi:hypothetical protein
MLQVTIDEQLDNPIAVFRTLENQLTEFINNTVLTESYKTR